MSETSQPGVLGALVVTPGVGRPAPARRVRRKVARLRDEVAAQEQELLRRHNTILALARDLSSLRHELDSVRREREQLERQLQRLVAMRSGDALQAKRLAEAVLDQQAAVVELERAAASAIASLG